MTSKLAIEDLEALTKEGCTVSPSDVVRLNALGLKLEKRPDFRMSQLPRVAMCGDVMFVQPTIEQDLFLDQMMLVFSRDAGTRLALEAYVLSHPEQDWSKPKTFPKLFATKCLFWIRRHLGKEIATKIRNAIDFVKYGVNPEDGEFPVYVKDDKFEEWYDSLTDEGSEAMRKYAEACACGIAPHAALKQTSPRLTAMIERMWFLKGKDEYIGDDEKTLTGQYYATLSEIQTKCRKERDERNKNNKQNEVN